MLPQYINNPHTDTIYETVLNAPNVNIVWQFSYCFSFILIIESWFMFNESQHRNMMDFNVVIYPRIDLIFWG